MKFHLLALTLLFVMVNGILFWKMGVMVDYDTEGYFLYASEIKARGWFFKPHLFWYSGYALFIVLMTSIYDSQVTVIVGQYFLSYLAMLSLYFSGRKLFQNPWAGFITCVWFIGFFIIQFWNLYLYAESLFISLNCFVLFFMVRWSLGERSRLSFGLGGLLILWAVLTKPMGINIIAGFLLLIVLTVNSKITNKFSQLAFFSTLLIPFLLLVNKMLKTYGFVENYQIGEIVYNIHKLAHKEYADSLLLKVPEDLFIPDTDYPPFVQLVLLIVMNPWYSLKMIAHKFFYFFLYVRPYYSWIHNILALGVLLPMYFSFLKEIKTKRIPKSLSVFVLTLIVFSSVSISLMSVNWNSRFLMPLLPVIFLIGGNRISQAILKVRHVKI